MLEGLPPNNATHVMRLVSNETRARAIADIIVETFDPAETAAAAFEIEPNAPAAAGGKAGWTVEVFFRCPPDEAQVRALAAAAAGTEAADALVFERIVERDWVKAALDGLPPVRAGRFLIHGAHARSAVRPNDIAIEIEAALAFGTGHHGTTRGCLLMLDQIVKRRRPCRVFDAGTGTGVLAIAAARVLRRRICAGDIDPIAVAAARANVRLNGAAPWVAPVVASAATHPRLHGGAPYDLIFANILAKPLRLMAPALAAVAHPHAELVLSGLLAAEVPGILSAYRAQGFALAQRLNLDGWSTLLLRRGGAGLRRRLRRTRRSALRRSARTANRSGRHGPTHCELAR